jgi:ketopantoate reductase
MAAPVLIWGTGAIGGSVGAWLKRAGHEVTFVDVVPDHVAAFENPAHGLQITGPVEAFTVRHRLPRHAEPCRDDPRGGARQARHERQ